MQTTQITYHSRVLITRRPARPGPPLTGITVARQLSPAGEIVHTCVLDEPTTQGHAIVDCLEADIILSTTASKLDDSHSSHVDITSLTPLVMRPVSRYKSKLPARTVYRASRLQQSHN